MNSGSNVPSRFGCFAFFDFELDADRWELRKDGQAVPVQPKAMQLLLYLVQHRDRLLPHAELFAALWPGVSVTESSLIHAVRIARRALGDGGGAQRIIRSVRTRGYRFVAEAADGNGLLGCGGAPRPQ